MDAAIILSTYNRPHALRLSLLGLVAQQGAHFEIIVADDGSDDRTRHVLQDSAFRHLSLQHVWHEDRGFRLSTIRNRAIMATSAEYLIFLDGDCIARNDFVASHLRHRRRGHFISGGRVDIPRSAYGNFTDEDILSNRVFDPNYLERFESDLLRQTWRLRCERWLQPVLNSLTWQYCVFHGSNASAWRDDVVRVNGFDERFTAYGSEDRDLGVRLRNQGVRSRYLKFSLVQLHLNHDKPYLDPRQQRAQRFVVKQRFRDRTTRVAMGLDSVQIRG